MFRAISLLGLTCLFLGCTTGTPVDSSDPTQATVDAGAAALPPFNTADPLAPASHFQSLASVSACKTACWADVPFNACLRQRNRCFRRNELPTHKEHCREMSRTCRKVRADCLHACNGAKAFGLETAEDSEPDTE
jgi:hypothetical protein